MENLLNQNFEIIDTIGNGSMSEVYLAKDKLRNENCAIKKIHLTEKINSEEALLRFKREANVISKLAHRYIINLYSLEYDQNNFYFIMEYYKGKNLKKIFNDFSFEEKIKIISMSAEALAYLHDNQIIHGDIKSKNILVNKNDNDLDLRIIDFGLAYLKNTKYIIENETLMGSLGYISPEQTGLLKRPIDARSDLYSLGITFYEIITGRLPFENNEINKLIHKHLAEIPQVPSKINSEIPPVIDDIILKLLKKEPENRYQSATGLKEDLDYFLKSPGKKHFTIGLRDKIEKLNYHIKATGRDEEIEVLNSAFNKCENNEARIVFLDGQAGIGKTKLFEEFKLRKSTSTDNLFFSFRCTQTKQNIPYAPFIDFIKTFFRNNYKKEFSNKLLDFIEDDLSLLVNIFPFLKNCPVFKKNEENIDVNLLDKKNVFSAINLLIKAIGNFNKVLIFFIDDIQYADKDTLDLIQFLSNNLNNTKLLLVTAFNEKNMPNEYLKNFKENKEISQYLLLKPIKKQSLYLFVNRVFGRESVYKEEFYNFLLRISMGVPFSIIEILKSLYEKGIIYSEKNLWRIQYENLDKFEKNFDISTILADKIKKLDKDEIAIICNASVIGREFDISFLSEVVEKQTNKKDLERIIAVIDKAKNLKIFDTDIVKGTGYYFFYNNKMLEYFYNGIEKEYCKKIHLICGELLEEKFNNNEYQNIFNIAYHYNLSSNLDKSFKINNLAYEKAISNYSLYETTYYLENIIKYKFEKNILDKELTEQIIEFSKYSNLCGKSKAGIKYLNLILKIAENNNWTEEIININLHMGNAYYILNQNKEAFRYFDIAMTIADSIGLEITDGIAYLMFGSAFLFSSQFMDAEISFSKAIDYIPQDDYKVLLPAYGLRSWVYLLLGDFEKEKEDVEFIERNIQYINDEIIITRLFHYMSYYYFMSGADLKTAKYYNDKAYDLALKNQNYIYLFGIYIAKVLIKLYEGDYKKAVEIGEEALRMAKEIKNLIGIRFAAATIAYAHLYNENFARANEIVDIYIGNEENYNIDKFPTIFFLIIKSLFKYYMNDIDMSLKKIDEAEELLYSFGALMLLPFVLSTKKFLYEQVKDFKISDEAGHKLNCELEKNNYLEFLTGQAEILISIVQAEKDKKDELRKLQKGNTAYDAQLDGGVLREKMQIDNIIKTSQNISSILDINELLEVIVEKTLEVTGAERAALLLINNKTGDLEAKIYKTIDKEKNIRFRVPKSIIQEVETTKKGFVFSTLEHEANLSPDDSIFESNIKSIVCSPLIYEGKMIGLLYLDSKLINSLFTDEDLEILKVFTTQAAISIINAEQNAKIRRQFSDSIQIIHSLLSNSSSRVFENTQKVTSIAAMLADEMEFNYSDIEKIRISSLLRDVGIIHLMDKFLYSKKALSEDEMEIFKKHPNKSVKIIEHLEGVDEIKKIIQQHQERWNGEGYPKGLKGEEICIGARIIGLVDDFVLLLRKRKFQTVDKKEQIINEIKKNSGILYDPELVNILVKLIDKENLIYIVNPNDIKITQYGDEIVWKIPSNINFEPIIVERIMQEINSKCDIDNELVFSIDFSLCEVIRNAIIHGNKYNESKVVTIKLKVSDLDIYSKKLSIEVLDEGLGMDISEHDRFIKSRNQIFYIVNRLKNYKVNNQELVNDSELENIITDLNNFKTDYYTDFNSFRQIDGSDISGGLGLIQVRKTFDTVDFQNMVKDDRVIGLKVSMEKFV